MNPPELHTQLEECFGIVFPDLPAAAIPQASMKTVPQWDSLGTLTLVGVIEEMFQIRLELDDIPTLTSFEAVAACLQSRLPARRAA